MSNVFFFETKRIEMMAAVIRARLIDLRKVKLSGRDFVSDPSLDQALLTMSVLRDQLTREIDAVEGATAGDARAILELARTVLADTSETVDLLLCLGARPAMVDTPAAPLRSR